MDTYEKTHALDTFGAGYRTDEEFRAELQDMVLIASSDEGGGYDWDVFYVYWHTKRERYYVISGTGCSCDWISYGVTRLGDFEDYPDKTALKAMIRRDYTGWKNPRCMDLIAQIENFDKRKM